MLMKQLDIPWQSYNTVNSEMLNPPGTLKSQNTLYPYKIELFIVV